MGYGPIRESPKALGLPAGKATTALAAYEVGQKLYNQGRSFWRDHFAYSVSVSEKDPLYSDVHDWLLSIMPSDRQRTLLVSSKKSRGVFEDSVPDDGTNRVSRSPLTVKFDDAAKRKVRISGHDITVQLHTPEVAPNASRDWEPPSKKIYFTAVTYSGQQAVIKELERINAEQATERKAVLRMLGQWGSWKVRSDLPPRTLESVALPIIQKNRIIDDLSFFLEAESRYNRLSIPWHRGYMFHGPPGTGKTSMAKAIACHFNLDMWYVSLSDLKTEASLLGLLAEVGPRSILLLEDVDTIKITHDRDVSEQGMISMGSLRNVLDGVATPHGLVTIMTTNHVEVLDESLLRSGRMDLVEKLDWPTGETLASMFKHFFGHHPTTWGDWSDSDKPVEGVSPAQIAEIFKQNLDNPEKAEFEAFWAITEPDNLKELRANQ